MSRVIQTLNLIDALTSKNVEYLFVELAPSAHTMETGYHFSGERKYFYQLLKDSGFTEIKLTPDSSHELLQNNIGIAYLSPTSVLSEEYEIEPDQLSIGQLIKTVFSVQPKFVLFLGKRVFHKFFDLSRENGIQKEIIGNARTCILPEMKRDVSAQEYNELVKYFKEIYQVLS